MKKYLIPKTRDPFINTPITHVDSGRYWISSWNSVNGSCGVLFDDKGEGETFRFELMGGNVGCGSYGVAYPGDNTLVLGSDLMYLTLFNFKTKQIEYLETKVNKRGLMFNGLVYDNESGKIFSGANSGGKLVCFSYDLSNRRLVKIFENFTDACLLRGSFKNRDGSYTFRMITGKSALYRWDPIRDTLEEICDIAPEASLLNSITDERGRVYIPGSGWLDSVNFVLEKDVMPMTEGEWFALKGDFAYGLSANASGAFCAMEGSKVLKWDIKTGRVEVLFEADELCFAKMTDSDEIILFTMYGEFIKIDQRGSLLLRKDLNIRSAGSVDCIVKIDGERIVGTPFISQRFWMLNLKTGQSEDWGRAGPGIGQVAKGEVIGKKVYFATYNRGVLTEFDPDKGGQFPENPRAVAAHPKALRPVAHTIVNDTYYYSSDFHYEMLGCVITGYDTITKEVRYFENPLLNQHITDMACLNTSGVIAALSGSRSDAGVMEVVEDICHMLTLTPDRILTKGILRGQFTDPLFICRIDGDKFVIKDSGKLVYSLCDFSLNTNVTLKGPEDVTMALCAPSMGYSYFLRKDEVILAKFSGKGFEEVEVVFREPGIYKIMVSNGAIFAVTKDYILKGDIVCAQT